MKFSLATVSAVSVLLASAVEAAPQGSAIPFLKPAKVTPKKTSTPALKPSGANGGAIPKQNNAAVKPLKQFGSNGGAIPKGNQAKNQGKGKGNQNNNQSSSVAATTTAADSSTPTQDVADAAASQAKQLSADELQTSLTLDPSQVQPGLANDGQAVPTAGQVASQTSTNNFINYCATRPDLPLTNGQQILTGSCNPTIMGEIIAKDKMPSAKIINPPNFSSVAKGTDVTFKIKVRNMDTGHFTNAQQNYFSAPQQGNQQGILIAHSHITVNQISSFQDPEPQDPQIFSFFKGLNEQAVDDVLTADAAGGFDVGFYRACTINSAANHQPAIVAVAQHASLDDCTYFQVTDGGADDTTGDDNNGNGASGNNNNNGKGGNNAVLSPKGSNGGQVNVKPAKSNKPTFSPPSRTAATANGRNGRGRRL